MDNNVKEEGGMSIGEFFRIVFSQRWLALIILAVVTLAGTLGIYFGKNSIDRIYEVSFTLELPQTEVKDEGSSATVVYYPDGTPFYYTDIVSIKTLQKVKDESKEDFKNLNIEKMSKNGDISISRSINETANNSGAYESIYNLRVKATYFPNKDVARKFVEELTKKPIEDLSLMDIDYYVYVNQDNYEDFAKANSDYISEISKLVLQSKYMKERYETFNEIYNDLTIKGRTLLAYKVDIESFITELESLRSTARTKGYLKTEVQDGDYNIELDRLQRQLDEATSILDSLIAGSNKSENKETVAALMAQAQLVADLQSQIKDIESFRDNPNKVYGDDVSQDFRNDLKKAYDKCMANTKEFKEVVSQLYGKVSVVSYSNSNVIVESGVTGIVMSLIISLVAGLVIAIIVSFIVGWSKIKKTAKALSQKELTDIQETQTADPEQENK